MPALKPRPAPIRSLKLSVRCLMRSRPPARNLLSPERPPPAIPQRTYVCRRRPPISWVLTPPPDLKPPIGRRRSAEILLITRLRWLTPAVDSAPPLDPLKEIKRGRACGLAEAQGQPLGRAGSSHPARPLAPAHGPCSCGPAPEDIEKMIAPARALAERLEALA